METNLFVLNIGIEFSNRFSQCLYEGQIYFKIYKQKRKFEMILKLS